MGTFHLHSLLLSILVTRTTVSADTSEVNPSSIHFNKPEVFLQTSTYVYHIATDLYKNDGSILFGTWDYIKTTDGKTTSTLATIPYTWVSGFTQVNSTHVVLLAYNHHCIKILDKQDSQLQTLAGTCGTLGYAEGQVGTGRLNYPWGVEVDVRNPGKLLVTDYGNHALRSVDLHTGELDTVVRSGLRYPFGMLWVNNKLLVTNQHYISKVNWLNNGTVTNTIITGSTSSGYVDGSFSESRFFVPHGLIEVGDGLILVADQSNKKLRLLNMNTGIVGPVCTNGVFPCTNGTRLQFYPGPFLKPKNEVYKMYVGVRDGIYRLSVSQVIRTLVFKGEYGISCSSIKDSITRVLLNSVIHQRKIQLQQICIEDCTMSSTKQPWFVCAENLLTVYWPTDNVYGADAMTSPSTLIDLLKERLQERPKMRTDIVILSQTPRWLRQRRTLKENLYRLLCSPAALTVT